MKRQSIYNKRVTEKNKKQGITKVALTVPTEKVEFFKFMAKFCREEQRGER